MPCAAAGARTTAPAFRALNRRLRGLLLEVEARTLDEVHQALDAGAERVLLDNMTPAAMRKAVEDIHLYNEATGHEVTTEASGRLTPETARAAAEAGVDFVSAGALTHSARAIDIALDIVAGRPQPRLKTDPARKPITRLLRIPKTRIPSPKNKR
jgi:nicotinate-nucleotide pyrophosphorylase (carboxylating)